MRFSRLAVVGMAVGLGWTGVGGRAMGKVDDGTGWVLTRLDLNLRVLPDEERLEGTAHMDLRLEAEASAGPRLALGAEAAPMRFVSVEGPAGCEVRLADDDKSDPSMHYTRVLLGEPAHRGDEIEVTSAWESDGRKTSQFVVEKRAALGSWVTAWYPFPAIGENESLSAAMSAPGKTRISIPASWTAVTNGTRTARTTEGKSAVETWTVDPAVARSFCVGPFTSGVEKVGDREVGVYLLGTPERVARDRAKVIGRALGAEEALFGPYPYPSYAVAEIPNGIGGFSASSEQGFIMAESQIFDAPGGNLPLFAHEMAHGWWGNLVGTTGKSTLWIDESLAQYSAVAAIEALEGPKAMEDFLEFSRPGYNLLQCAAGYFYIWRKGGDRPMSELGSGAWDHNLSDSKGMWVYHMLRERIGDERFFGVLRGLITAHSHGAMTIAEVREAFEKVAPEAGLEAFFSQWLDRTGAPALDVDWWAARNAGKSRVAHVEIDQVQPGEPFSFDLELLVRLRGGGSVTRRVTVDKAHQVFEVETGEARPVELEVDPDREVLMWRPAYGPRPGAGETP